MNDTSTLTEADAAHCVAIKDQMMAEPDIWNRYVDLVAAVENTEGAFDVTSNEVNNYIAFITNDLRPWILEKDARFGEDKDLFEHFHKLINAAAKPA